MIHMRIQRKMLNAANTKENAERWAMAATHPDRADIDAAMDFARLMQRKIVVLESFAKRQTERE